MKQDPIDFYTPPIDNPITDTPMPSDNGDSAEPQDLGQDFEGGDITLG